MSIAESDGMERTIGVLNKMVEDGIIAGYVIGGAIAAMFYIDPVETADLDIFVLFPKDKLIVSLEDIFGYLRDLGYIEFSAEGIIVEGMPVQFLPAFSPLLQEAYRQAVLKQVGSTLARIASLEHLMAVMLEVGRPKDKLRLANCRLSASFDEEKLLNVLERFHLTDRWTKFQQTIL
jgi:hypothetical protein